jgi:hypothetical protein
MGTGPVAVAQLACPACSDGGDRTVDVEPQAVTGLDGRQTAELAGECRRCGSRVACQPSEAGAAAVRQYERDQRDVTAQLRATLDAAQPPLDAEDVDAARQAVAAEVISRRDAAEAVPL